jgi:hypothetical protein
MIAVSVTNSRSADRRALLFVTLAAIMNVAAAGLAGGSGALPTNLSARPRRTTATDRRNCDELSASYPIR